jgi:hypothetical protein
MSIKNIPSTFSNRVIIKTAAATEIEAVGVSIIGATVDMTVIPIRPIVTATVSYFI